MGGATSREGIAGVEVTYPPEAEAFRRALTVLGAAALIREGRRPFKHYRTDEPGAPNSTNSWLDVALLNARSGTVYAGTSQIQRNIIGESILGLPKEPVPQAGQS